MDGYEVIISSTFSVFVSNFTSYQCLKVFVSVLHGRIEAKNNTIEFVMNKPHIHIYFSAAVDEK